MAESPWRLAKSDPELVLALLPWLGPGAELLSPVSWRPILRAQIDMMLLQVDDTTS